MIFCIRCGSLEGIPDEDPTTPDDWIYLGQTAVGPFCSESCLKIWRTWPLRKRAASIVGEESADALVGVIASRTPEETPVWGFDFEANHRDYHRAPKLECRAGTGEEVSV